jgi:hypothetical protein
MKSDSCAHDDPSRLKRQPLSRKRRQRETLNVDLGDLKAEAIALAKIQGSRSVGAWIKELVALALQEHREHPVVASPVRVAANRRPGAEVVKFGGYLTVEQSEALGAVADAEGLSKIEYVMAVAAGMLVPQRQEVVAELGVLNTVLQAIEQDLRGMAQRVHEPAVVVKLQSTVRLVRAQALRAAEVLDDLSATRRTAARRGAGR